MESKLKLGIVQFTPEKNGIQQNIDRLWRLLQNSAADIFVLPELCLSGYYFNTKTEAKKFSQTQASLTKSFFSKLAHQKNAIVIGGFIEREQNNLYNSAVMVIPEQPDVLLYRKAHLFYHEPKVFSPGNTGFYTYHDPKRDVCIGMMICYDWRFPEVTRKLALQNADLIVCPSNLITNVWDKVLPGRCIENKIYMAVANRCGEEKTGEETLKFSGESAVFSCNGQALTKASKETDEVLLVDIYPKKTRNKSISETNHLFNDRLPMWY